MQCHIFKYKKKILFNNAQKIILIFITMQYHGQTAGIAVNTSATVRATNVFQARQTQNCCRYHQYRQHQTGCPIHWNWRLSKRMVTILQQTTIQMHSIRTFIDGPLHLNHHYHHHHHHQPTTISNGEQPINHLHRTLIQP